MMKEIIKVLADDENIRIIIDGDNIDLLKAISEIIKKMEEQSGVSKETSIAVIKKMLEGD